MVVFKDGDRLTGNLTSVDTQSIEVIPLSKSIGPLKLNWIDDGIDELRLDWTNKSPGYIYFLAKDSSKNGRAPLKTAEVTLAPDGTLHLRLRESAESLLSMAEQRTFSSLTLITPTPSPVAQASQAAPSAQTAPVAVSAASPAPQPASKIVTMWSFNMNAPESFVNATQSSQTFGGGGRADTYFGDANHLILVAGGTHQHNASIGKAPITTDISDSYAQFSHAFVRADNQSPFAVYGVGEWFLNTSLGMAAERSGGVGMAFPTVYSGSENLSFAARVELRYFNERLYTPTAEPIFSAPPVFNLLGSRIQGQLGYAPSDLKWFIKASWWYNPMFNHNGANWQAYGNLTLAVPLGNHFCLGLTPADDTYFERVPKGNRRNYLGSKATLQVALGRSAAEKCQ
jgi:hypothetical protein